MATVNEVGADGVTRHLSHRWDDETALGERIVGSIAEYEETEAASLPALEESINPAALEELFATTDSGPAPGCVTFSYYGYTVVVQSTGQVLLRKD